MNYQDKINIYVPQEIGNMLDKDATMFEIVKKDKQTINRNKFLSSLILGYYNSYVAECQKIYSQIVSELEDSGIPSDKTHAIASGILNKIFLPEVPSRKGKHPSKLSLKPTKQTEGLIANIMSELPSDQFISQYFCRLLLSYCEKPFSIREQIVFRDNYEFLQSACTQRKPISFFTIWNPIVNHTVIPYQLAVGYEEFYNYLLCAEINPSTGKQEAKSYRLNRITNIQYKQRSNQISDEVMEYLQRMLQYGPQYSINDSHESCVKLSDAGQRNYSRIYYGRPQEDRVENGPDGHYYYYKCSKDQIYLYFRRFEADDAEIISPPSLRKRMSEFHLQAYKQYDR